MANYITISNFIIIKNYLFYILNFLQIINIILILLEYYFNIVTKIDFQFLLFSFLFAFYQTFKNI